jgi:hypothetical protein
VVQMEAALHEGLCDLVRMQDQACKRELFDHLSRQPTLHSIESRLSLCRADGVGTASESTLPGL